MTVDNGEHFIHIWIPHNEVIEINETDDGLFKRTPHHDAMDIPTTLKYREAHTIYRDFFLQKWQDPLQHQTLILTSWGNCQPNPELHGLQPRGGSPHQQTRAKLKLGGCHACDKSKTRLPLPPEVPCRGKPPGLTLETTGPSPAHHTVRPAA